VIVREGRALRRWVLPRLRQWAGRARCAVLGHEWSPWTVDDMDGPGEDLGDGAFLPYCCRDARRDEPYATRACRRGSWPWRCGTTAQRVPAVDR
jgi:hypothetical protein